MKTKKMAFSIPITLNKEELTAFGDAKNSLCGSVLLTFPSEEDIVCVFTDASDLG